MPLRMLDETVSQTDAVTTHSRSIANLRVESVKYRV